MHGSKKNSERPELVHKDKKGPTKLEPLRPQAKHPDKLREEMAKFLSECPYPVLRIHKNGMVLFANKASEMLLNAKGSGIGRPAPQEWRRLTGEILASNREGDLETEHNERIFGFRAAPFIDSDYVNFYGADITEHKRAEKALLKERNFARSLVETAQAIILVLDTQGRIVNFNPYMEEVSGYQLEEIRGRDWFDTFLPERDRQRIRALFLKAVSDIQTRGNVNPIVTKDGRERVIEWYDKTLKDNTGNIVGLLCIGQDITERKRAEEALQERERYLRKAQQIAHFGSWVLDVKTNRVEFSDEMFNIFGITKKQFNGVPEYTNNLVKPEDQARVQQCYEDLLIRHKPVSMEYSIIRPDGSVRHLWGNGKVEFDEKGNLKRLVGTVLDITERKKAEQALRESEDKFRGIFEHANDCIIYLDSSGRILDINEKARQIFGGPRKQVLNRHFIDLDIFSTKDKPALMSSFEGVLSGKEPVVTIIIKNKDGRNFVLECSASLRRTGDEATNIMVIARDITERKQAEEALLKEKKLSEELINSSVDGILAYDHKCQYTIWNPGMERISGVKKGEALGRCAFDVFAFLKETGEDKFFYDALAGKTVVAKDRPYRVPKTGKKGFFEGHYAPLYDKEGNISGGLAIIRDITERKRAEERLQAERNLLRTLIDHIPDKVYVKDKDSRFVVCNKSTIASNGAEKEEELIGKTDFDLYEKSLAQQFFDDEQELMRTGRPIINHEIPASDGSVRSMLVTKVPLWDSSGNIVGMVGINRDITERKKAEKEMVRLNRVMETITDINQCIFRIQDRNGLLKKICEIIVKYAYRLVWIGFCDEKSKLIVPQAQAGFEEGYLDSVKITYNDSEHGMGPSGMAVKTAKPDVMRFITTDPRYEPWRAEAMKRGYRSSAAIPIFSEDKVIGALSVYAEKDDAFGLEEVKLLEELAHDISTGLRGIDEQTRRRQAEHKILEYQKQLKRLAAQLALAEERERRRIAGELHDQVTQSLALAKIKLDSLHASATSQPLARALENVSASLEKAIRDTRSLTFDLSSPILHELGFEAAVAEWLNEQVCNKHGIATEFQEDNCPKPLDDDIRTILFRNIRELLINIIKYANANKVKVGIRRTDDSIEVTVEDNGIGFDPIEVRSMAAKRTEFGLLSIRESLEELGGHFEIESKPGAGCKAIMMAPLKGENLKKEK